MSPLRPFALTRRELVAAGAAMLAAPQNTFAAAEAVDSSFDTPQDVAIKGYTGDAMEPFLSRDGKLLLFNNRNEPPEETDLHWAERVDDRTFSYRGKIEGANSAALDGVPSMGEGGALYFVSTRSYATTFSTIYRAEFSNGRTTKPELVEGISRQKPGWVNFDAEISADGSMLIFVDSWFGTAGYPQSAELVIAERNGNRFARRDDSPRLLSAINGKGLVYAPALSVDQRELFFTAVAAITPDAQPAIFRSTRADPGLPFGTPHRVAALDGFVEGPSLSADGNLLYFHAKIADRYCIRVARRESAGAGQ